MFKPLSRPIAFAIIFAALLISVLTACAPSGIPQAAGGTLLRKIQDRGKLIIGTTYDQPTFDYLDPQTKTLEGFDPAVAHEIAAYIFGDPNKIEFKEITSDARIPDLQNGTVDLVLLSMTITADRWQQIDFSVVYYVAGQRLLVPSDSSIKGVADLPGRKVGTAKGTTSAANLTQFNPDVVLYDTFSDATNGMLNKEVEAVSTDDTILYGLALQHPGLQIVGAQFSYEPYGVGVAKNNPELLNAVNTVIRNLKTTGKWKEIWKKEIGDKVGLRTIPDPPVDAWQK